MYWQMLFKKRPSTIFYLRRTLFWRSLHKRSILSAYFPRTPKHNKPLHPSHQPPHRLKAPRPWRLCRAKCCWPWPSLPRRAPPWAPPWPLRSLGRDRRSGWANGGCRFGWWKSRPYGWLLDHFWWKLLVKLAGQCDVWSKLVWPRLISWGKDEGCKCEGIRGCLELEEPANQNKEYDMPSL